MDKNTSLNGAIIVLTNTLVFIILMILTESPSLTDIATSAILFALLSGVTYFAISSVMARAKKSN